MASVVEAFNEALSEDLSLVKIVLYSIPVYFTAKNYIAGNMVVVDFWGFIASVLILGLLTQGINSVRLNKSEILTLNPIKLFKCIILACVVLIPQILIFGYIGYLITSHVNIPIDLPHVPLIFNIIVWSIIFSIVFTAYLSFAKYLSIIQGFNLKLIFESCVDVFISLLFFIPQLLIANLVLVGPVAYLFLFFGAAPSPSAPSPLTNWAFVAYSSMAFIVNISILANYFSQVAYENIKGNDSDYIDRSRVDISITDLDKK